MHTLTSTIKKINIIAALVFATSFANAQQPGNMDLTFTSGIEELYGVTSMIAQPDGKIILGGSLITYDGTNSLGIARINPDGSRDTTFDPGDGAQGMVADGTVLCVALQSDGKILIGGFFYSYDNTPINCIARLNPNGSLDTSFLHTGAMDGSVNCIAVQPNGKILIGGNFSTYNGIERNNLARINADGTLDTSFIPGATATDMSSQINTIAVSQDGAIYVGGKFDAYNGIPRKNIVKLNPDGTLASTYNSGLGTNSPVNTCALQADGKLLIAGYFDLYNGTSTYPFCRINENGTLDTSFNAGSYDIKAIKPQPDGKIFLAGALVYNSIHHITIFRLSSDGSLDITFSIGAGAEGPEGQIVSTMALYGDRIYAGGHFTSYNDTQINSLVKLYKEDCNLTAPEGPSEQIFTVNDLTYIPLNSLDVTGESLTWYASQEDLENGIPLSSDTAAESGITYYVTQTIDGCVSEPHAITVTIVLGIEEFSGKSNLVYYPNPVKDYLTISSPKLITKVRVYTIYGTLLKEEDWNTEKGSLNLESLNAGSYIINIQTDKTDEKIVVIRS